MEGGKSEGDFATLFRAVAAVIAANGLMFEAPVPKVLLSADAIAFRFWICANAFACFSCASLLAFSFE